MTARHSQASRAASSGRPVDQAAKARTYSAYAFAQRSPCRSQTPRISSHCATAASRSPWKARAMASSIRAIITLLFSSPRSV
ncbi:hypothetical protein NKH77_03610 [Streptomyces sp. M19]